LWQGRDAKAKALAYLEAKKRFVQQQIPFGDDNKKSKDNGTSKDNSNSNTKFFLLLLFEQDIGVEGAGG
jgi:hypothetical protein